MECRNESNRGVVNRLRKEQGFVLNEFMEVLNWKAVMLKRKMIHTSNLNTKPIICNWNISNFNLFIFLVLSDRFWEENKDGSTHI